MESDNSPAAAAPLGAALDAERAARLRLEAAHAATRVLATATSTEEALAGVLAEVCRALDFQWAGFWEPAAGTTTLSCAVIYEADAEHTAGFSALVRRLRFEAGVGLPGRVWESGTPAWISVIAEDPNFPRLATAAQVGLRGGFCFPVTIGDEVAGVMEFFANRPVEANDALLESLAAVGGQIGLFILRRRAEEALRDSEARFRAFAESVSDAAFAMDEQSTIVYVNPAVRRIFGWEPDSLVGQPMTVLIPERMREAHRQGVERHLATGRRHIPWEGVELPGLHRDGSEVPLEISFGSYTIEGRHFFTGIARDVSERNLHRERLESTAAELETAVEDLRERTLDAESVRAEAERARAEAEQASRAKSDFLAIISHELRTPLNAIIGYTDLLLAGIPKALPTHAHGQVSRVRAAGLHLLELIEEILTFSRIEAGGEVVLVETVDLAALIRSAVEIAEPLAQRKGLDVHVRIPEGAVADTDPGMVRQILINLISNAVKFTDAGEIAVSGEVENGGILLRVRDTGIGIKPEHVEQIFDPFWQAETAATRRQGGTGLGLSVARQLARLLGGDIAVESTPGHGATFTVLLPRPQPAPEGPH